MRIAIAALALLAACSPAEAPKTAPADQAATPALVAPAPTTPAFTFSCANGKSFTVSFDQQARSASILAGGQNYVLQSAPSASGARYGKGEVSFSEHQGQATLTGVAGGPYENCRRA